MIADVQNRLSADGVTYRTDDTPPTTYGDVLDEASREIDFYLLNRYDADLLATSNWVT
jgi:phage gp36-like protein